MGKATMSDTERQALEEAISKLPPTCRMALILVRGGATDEEAAKQLGVSTDECGRLVEAAMVYLLTVCPSTKR